MPGFPECTGCEFRDRPEVCLAVAQNHRRYCDLIHREGRDDYREMVRNRTLDPAWRRTPETRLAPIGQSSVMSRRLARVAACKDRGSVLPHTEQKPCGCGGELSECRAGKGKVAGRVTLAECLECVSAEPG